MIRVLVAADANIRSAAAKICSSHRMHVEAIRNCVAVKLGMLLIIGAGFGDTSFVECCLFSQQMVVVLSEAVRFVADVLKQSQRERVATQAV